MLKITDDNYDNYKRVLEMLWIFNAKYNKLDPNREDSLISRENAAQRQKEVVFSCAISGV